MADAEPGAHLVRALCQTVGDAGATLAALALLLGRPPPLAGGSRPGYSRSGSHPGAWVDGSSSVEQSHPVGHRSSCWGVLYSSASDTLEYLSSASGAAWPRLNLTLIGDRKGCP